ncbi:TSUP family transporter [candidate division GN15 bacterium]|nr:TSUP family transporter [candidate division GN15 bacterium]
MEFPVSGVETYWWLPALVAFCISVVTSTGGVTGAFILLPFQISVLGFTGPGASPTNLAFNIFAIPSGVWRFHREQRMLWSLAWATGLGTLPGVVIGAWIRIRYLPDPAGFKLFAGCVLLYLGAKLIYDLINKRRAPKPSRERLTITAEHLGLRKISYTYGSETYDMATGPIILLSLVVGIVGGAYGIGGGAILSPYFVAIYHLPVHSIAGAMLLGTWITSIAGVIIFVVISPLITGGTVIEPDWLLGLSFGVGGALGVYTGAFLQRFIAPMIIKIVLVVALLFIAGKYIMGYFW